MTTLSLRLPDSYHAMVKEITAKERCKIYMKAICPWLCKINEWRKKYVR